MNEEPEFTALYDSIVKKLIINDMEDLDPDIHRVIEENFEDLIWK